MKWSVSAIYKCSVNIHRQNLLIHAKYVLSASHRPAAVKVASHAVPLEMPHLVGPVT
jgi:hypothetical protein